jgi:hypothetical protein
MPQQAATITTQSLNSLKASALDHVLQELEAMGFSTNDPINGGDCVEAVAILYQRLRKRFPKDSPAAKGDAHSDSEVQLDGAMSLTLTVDLLRKPEPFPSAAAAVEWAQSCLNRNVNHVLASLTLHP